MAAVSSVLSTPNQTERDRRGGVTGHSGGVTAPIPVVLWGGDQAGGPAWGDTEYPAAWKGVDDLEGWPADTHGGGGVYLTFGADSWTIRSGVRIGDWPESGAKSSSRVPRPTARWSVALIVS